VCLAVAVLAGSMAGLPPFVGFLSKELVLEKLMLADVFVHDIAVIGIVLGSIGTVAYTARFFFGSFAGSPRSEGARAPRRAGPGFLLGPGILAAISLAAGSLAAFTDRIVLEPLSAALLGYPLAAPALSLWHGVNVPLVLSVVIVVLGLLLYRYNERHSLPAGPAALGGEPLFERLLAGANSLGALCSRALAAAPPGVYSGLLLALAFVWALPLGPRAAGAMASAWHPGGAIVLALLALALALLVGLPSAVGRILAFTAVGFSVAMLYSLLLAPDLMLTQLLVEVLTTVFFLLAARLVADHAPPAESPRRIQAVRLVFASVLGVGGAGLVIALQAVAPDTRLSDFYFEAGPILAKGHNLVNLVLGDFRALDTLVETLVVLATALGVAALLLGREVPSRPGVRR
jgi:multicomponent Na+:H+ antiporter subunit A